jgi:hypothetical protein
MTPRRKRSKKPFAANSTALRLERAVFYLDESIYSRALLRALQDVGANVEYPGPDRAIPFGTPDTEWLAVVGEKRWIVFSRDKRVRQRAIEKQVLVEARVAAFIYTGGQASADDTCTAVLKALPKILNIAVSERRPLLYTIGRTGVLARLAVGRSRRKR